MTEPGAPWSANEVLRYNALVYAVTGNLTAGNKAKAELLELASWPSSTHPDIEADGHLVDYDTGKFAVVAGEAYDWVYPLLNETERELVRTAIMDNAVEPAHTDYMNGAYLSDARSNRAAHAWGGIGVAALAIMGDGTEDPNLQTYFGASHAVMDEYVDEFSPEGGWPEGVSYLSYGLCDGSGALFYMDALKRVKGENLYAHPGFSGASSFPLYFLPPDRAAATDGFGDSGFSEGFAACAIAKLANEYGDGYAQWYYNNVPVYSYDRAARFIWANSSLPESDPSSLPQSKQFTSIGWVALRSGFSESDALIQFKSGPIPESHGRPDQNAFAFDALGERLLVCPGMPSDGYSNPHYNDYYFATVSENTVLINNDTMSQARYPSEDDPGGSITGFITTGFYDSVTGAAEGAYEGVLAKFDRTISFVKPDYAVLFDDIESSEYEKEFESLFHALGSGSISIAGDTAVITRNGVKLHAKILSPSPFDYDIIAGEPQQPGGVDTATSYLKIWGSRAETQKFLVILYPLPASSALPQITKLENGSALGYRMENGGSNDTMLFDPSKGGINSGGVVSNGAQAFVRNSLGGVARSALSSGSSLAFNSQTLFASSSTSSAAFNYTASRVGGIVDASGAGAISVHSRTPVSVTVNGAVLPGASWSYDAPTGLISFPVGGGNSTIEIQTS
ncbi:Heparinase II/III-like protein [uncultured archaeon]|nr:Heparinase II/III-like protein [uncultured archaeon]